MTTRWIAALLGVVLFVTATPVVADESWPKWDAAVRLDFARCLYAEDSSGTDWSALGWSLVKQWRLKRRRIANHTFRNQIRWYCAMFEKLGPRWLGKRPHLIRIATWDSPPYATAARKWAELREFVDEFASKSIEDPCPACIWWGGPNCDVMPPNWTCPLQPPITKNAFCHQIGMPGR